MISFPLSMNAASVICCSSIRDNGTPLNRMPHMDMDPWLCLREGGSGAIAEQLRQLKEGGQVVMAMKNGLRAIGSGIDCEPFKHKPPHPRPPPRPHTYHKIALHLPQQTFEPSFVPLLGWIGWFRDMNPSFMPLLPRCDHCSCISGYTRWTTYLALVFWY